MSEKHLFRVMNNETHEWWEGMATDDFHACRLAGWEYEICYIRMKSMNGSGGWKKYKKDAAK